MELYNMTEEELRGVREQELAVLREVDRLCAAHGLRYCLGYGTLLGAIRHKGFIPWDDDVDIAMPREDFDRLREICATELDGRFFYQSHYTDKNYYYPYDKIRVNGTVFREIFFADRDMHQGVFIDVFPVDHVPEDERLRLRQRRAYRRWYAVLRYRFLGTAGRSGLRGAAVRLFRFLTGLFPMDWLYKKVEGIMTRYNGTDTGLMSMFISDARGRETFPRSYYDDLTYAPFENDKFLIPRAWDEMLEGKFGDYMTLPPVEQRVSGHKLVEVRL